MKKLFSLVLVIVMTSVSSVALAEENVYSKARGTAQAYALDVSEPTYYVGMQTISSPAEAPLASDIKTVVTVTNYGNIKSLTAVLVVAVKNKSTGAIYDIGMDDGTVKNATSLELSASAALPNAKDYVYEYFVWDNLDNMISLGNEAPLAPTGLKEDEEKTTTSTITLNWNPAEDDIGVTSYEIYRDGAKVGSTTETSYTDYGLDDNAAYFYTVAAVDGRELSSAPSKAVTAVTKNIAWIDMKGENVALGKTGEDGLNIYKCLGTEVAAFDVDNYADAYAEDSDIYSIGDYFGRTCYVGYKTTTAQFGMMFTIDGRSELKGAAAGETTFIFDYYDNSNDPITFRYRYGTGSSKSITAVGARGDSKAWKRCVLTVDDAEFASSNNFYFCFAPNSGAPIYISNVGVARNYVSKTEALNAPENLSATPNASTIKLTWDAVVTKRTEILGYNIYDGGGNKIASTTDTYYEFTDLTNGEAYSYSVTAFAADDNESPNSVTVTAIPSAAPAPTGFKVREEAVTTSTAALEWTDNGAEKYNLYYKVGDDSGEGVETYTWLGDVTGAECTVVGLNDGEKYSFKITAYKENEESDPSAAVSAATTIIDTINMSDLSSYSTASAGPTTDYDSYGVRVRTVGGTWVKGFDEAAAQDSSCGIVEYGTDESGKEWCYASKNMSKSKYGMLIDIAASSVFRTQENDVTLIIRYFDNGNAIRIRHRGSVSSGTDVTLVTPHTGTNTWKTAKYNIGNVKFLDPKAVQFTTGTDDGAIYISEVSLAINYIEKADAIAIQTN